MERNIDLMEALEHIDPAVLDYTDWTLVGMALKEEGYSWETWDEWSRSDSRRYHPNDCRNKWQSFRGGAGTKVTGGTIVQMAKDQGWSPAPEGHEIGWNDEIGGDDLQIIDTSWLESREVQAPKNWDPAGQLIDYLMTLFESTEIVGYVTESWKKDDKYLPTKGDYSRTAGQLIEALSKCGGDLGAVLGDYKEEAGAWIRFNPLDGSGVRNENVTEFRYALVESDTMPIEQQNALLRELELPIACLTHSGGKSLHAIVHIDAGNYEEYRKRVDYLYNVLQKNGMEVDTQNKNPSRLSRMPGVIRNGHKQFLVDTNIGKSSWAEWREWIESVNDDLPELESLGDVWGDMPELAPSLIEGVLRQGHKMLLAGPSKAGKSFALIELAISIAEGRRWFGWQCAQGKVLYVNLELDRASCLHRFKDVYDALGWGPSNIGNIDIWNLRGKSVPMDKLAPKLIRRAKKRSYIAIIIDPIYKVITGDENSADQMAAFCNQFDLVCTDLGCAVIYCHHHSKGYQGAKKSMDRASGSGVFARDPDALLDLTELEQTDELIQQRRQTAMAESYYHYIEKNAPELLEDVSQDDRFSAAAMREHIGSLPGWKQEAAQKAAQEAGKAAESVTAWRIEGTLREYPKFLPVDLWFDYPVHHLDDTGVLGDLAPEGDVPYYDKGNKKHMESSDRKKASRIARTKEAIANCNAGGPATLADLQAYFTNAGEREWSERTIRNWIKEAGYAVDKNSGYIVPQEEIQPRNEKTKKISVSDTEEEISNP